jgi:hypothetical protein
MYRSKKIRAVLNELKESIEEGPTTLDLLECANLIVEITSSGKRQPYGAMEPRKTFDELPLDVIFSERQWHLVTREYCSEEEPAESYMDPKLIINQLFHCGNSSLNSPRYI